MTETIPLTPGFSPVAGVGRTQNRFNGFARAGKPLKRLEFPASFGARLQPGVNKIRCVSFAQENNQNKI